MSTHRTESATHRNEFQGFHKLRLCTVILALPQVAAAEKAQPKAHLRTTKDTTRLVFTDINVKQEDPW
eukprot:52665-Eustigmatos_ZCMA.PRE.1